MENIEKILQDGIPGYDVNQNIMTQWQELVDIAATLMDVPACVIMRLKDKDIQAFVTSEGEENPFEAGAGLTFYGSGVYCETVIKNDQKLYVHNARKEKEFENCPEIGLDLISYLGYPINHEGGMPFGTLCIYDKKERDYSAKQEHLILQIKNMLENHLKLLQTTTDLKESQTLTQNSINFASQIQKSLLPNNDILPNFFKDSFVIWKPKDSVGGDIYFANQINEDELLIIFVDCTGHGVAAAMITMIVKTIEEQIRTNIATQGSLSPGEILSIFNLKLKQIFSKDAKESFDFAGFDGAVIQINKENLTYSGAKMPLYIINKNNELERLKPDRISIGYKQSDINHVFKEETISLKEYNKFYLSSDGYWDQFGGEEGLSFGKSNFLNLIKENHHKSFSQQKEIFIDTLNSYMKNEDQIDDISILAFETKEN